MNNIFRKGIIFFTVTIIALMIANLIFDIPNEVFGTASSILVIADAICVFMNEKNSD